MAKESDIAAVVVEWLEEQHFDVYQEVAVRGVDGVADIIAVRAGIVWAVETKTGLNVGVLNQAQRKMAHYRYAAYPRPKMERMTSEHHCLERLALNYFKVGLLWVLDGGVQERQPAPLMRGFHRDAMALASQLRPEQKTFAPAGTNRGGHWTPYKATISQVRRFLERRPDGASLREILAEINNGHWSGPASARNCLRVALTEWESDWCEGRGEGKNRRWYVRHSA